MHEEVFGSTFKIYPESDHFLPPQLTPKHYHLLLGLLKWPLKQPLLSHMPVHRLFFTSICSKPFNGSHLTDSKLKFSQWTTRPNEIWLSITSLNSSPATVPLSQVSSLALLLFLKTPDNSWFLNFKCSSPRFSQDWLLHLIQCFQCGLFQSPELQWQENSCHIFFFLTLLHFPQMSTNILYYLLAYYVYYLFYLAKINASPHKGRHFLKSVLFNDKSQAPST